jgi:uncharacterized protein YbjT (DUF2867 family)
MARRGAAAGLQHVIWSTLEDTRRWCRCPTTRMPTLMGRYKVPHFDAKGEADRFFTDAGVPTTFLLTSFYWDNLIHFGMGPKRGPDGALVFVLPMGDAPLPGIAVEDIGRCAYGIFRRGPSLIGPDGGHRRRAPQRREMATELGRALGRPVRTSRHAGALPRPGLPRRRGPGEHVPPRGLARAEPGAADLRPVAAGEQGAHPPGVGPRRRARRVPATRPACAPRPAARALRARRE